MAVLWNLPSLDCDSLKGTKIQVLWFSDKTSLFFYKTKAFSLALFTSVDKTGQSEIRPFDDTVSILLHDLCVFSCAIFISLFAFPDAGLEFICEWPPLRHRL